MLPKEYGKSKGIDKKIKEVCFINFPLKFLLQTWLIRNSVASRVTRVTEVTNPGFQYSRLPYTVDIAKCELYINVYMLQSLLGCF